MGIELAAVGTAVAGAFFTAGTVAFAVTTIAVSVVAGAVIGATIGGLTAALVGGDISKGLLYGAIGGAVTGGIGAWGEVGSTFSSAGTDIGTSVASTGSTAEGAAGTQIAASNADKFYSVNSFTSASDGVSGITGGVPTTGSTSLLAKTGQLAGSNIGGLAQAGATIGGKVIEGYAAGETNEATLKAQAEQQAIQNALSEKLYAANNATSVGIASLNADVQKRGQDITATTAANALQAQIDDAATERELAVQTRERKSGAVASQSIASSEGQLKGTSIRDQVYGSDQEAYT